MISVPEAQERILAGVEPAAPQTYELADAMGLVLADGPVADLDMPPFDKAAVDGYAVKACDAVAGRSFVVVEEVMAGQQARTAVSPGRSIKIMTGAPVPPSAETIIMLESTRLAGDRVEVVRDTRPGTNLCKQGEDVRAGQPLLPAGTVVAPQQFGLLAGQGCTKLSCHRRPVVAILATGNEVVPPDVKPAPTQIRNANNLLLAALVRRALGEVLDLGIAADEPDAMREHMSRGLEADILLCSGGVSAGTLDLVPDAAKRLGVEEVFHHVALQPGRPVFYGRRSSTHFFGLPGNPVASATCFKVLVEPLLRRLAGHADVLPQAIQARFEGTFKRTDERTRYVGVQRIETAQGRTARRIPTHGPADVSALARCNALAILPPCTGPYHGGETVEVIEF